MTKSEARALTGLVIKHLNAGACRNCRCHRTNRNFKLLPATEMVSSWIESNTCQALLS
jgi:hypothetical protein